MYLYYQIQLTRTNPQSRFLIVWVAIYDGHCSRCPVCLTFLLNFTLIAAMDPPSSQPLQSRSSSVVGGRSWVCCLYPAESMTKLETNGSRNEIHVMSDPTSDPKLYLLAMTLEASEGVRQGQVPVEWRIDHIQVATPSKNAENVRGKVESRKQALLKFRQNAIGGIEVYGNQIGQVYRKHHEYQSVWVQVEGGILVSDIKVNPSPWPSCQPKAYS